MARFHFSQVAQANPSTIWTACFSHMKWEIWDPDVQALLEVSGGCKDGTTFIFHMKDGGEIPGTLSNVVENKSLTFSGGVFGGLVHCEGTVIMEKQEEKVTRIDYTFAVSGCAGALMSIVLAKMMRDGTEHGLANMVRLSEEAEAKVNLAEASRMWLLGQKGRDNIRASASRNEKPHA